MTRSLNEARPDRPRRRPRPVNRCPARSKPTTRIVQPGVIEGPSTSIPAMAVIASFNAPTAMCHRHAALCSPPVMLVVGEEPRPAWPGSRQGPRRPRARPSGPPGHRRADRPRPGAVRRRRPPSPAWPRGSLREPSRRRAWRRSSRKGSYTASRRSSGPIMAHGPSRRRGRRGRDRWRSGPRSPPSTTTSGIPRTASIGASMGHSRRAGRPRPACRDRRRSGAGCAGGLPPPRSRPRSAASVAHVRPPSRRRRCREHGRVVGGRRRRSGRS